METQDMNSRKVETEIAELMATTTKLNAETAKISKEAQYYPWVIVVSAAIGGAVVGVFSLLLKAI